MLAAATLTAEAQTQAVLVAATEEASQTAPGRRLRVYETGNVLAVGKATCSLEEEMALGLRTPGP